MSDWIMHNGRKYFEEGYLKMANGTAERRGQTIKDLNDEVDRMREVIIKLRAELKDS